MRKRVKPKSEIFISTLVIFLLIEFCSKPDSQDLGVRGIEFVFQPGIRNCQIAVWVEEINGKYIGTIFLTDFIGREGGGNRSSNPDLDDRGGNRLNALPIWSHKRGVVDTTFGLENFYPPPATEPSYPDDIDAVSAATPGTGIKKILWEIPDLPNGIYNCWIEVNRSFDFNDYHNYSYYRGQPSVVWNVSISVTENRDSRSVLNYSGYGSPDGSDGNINPPDATITTAANLLRDMDGYKFKVNYTPR